MSLLCILIATLAGLLWVYVISPRTMLIGRIIPRVETSQKVVALTLDDGPLPGATEETLAQLQKSGVKATFFVIGVEAKRHPEQLKKIVEAGHQVGNHSYSHAVMISMSQQKIAKEIESTDTLIRQAGYKQTIFFRAPYNYKFIGLPWYLYSHNRVDISRDVIPAEGYNDSPAMIADQVVSKVQPGSIILMHPMYKRTKTSREALPLIVKALEREGYRFVTISELLHIEGT